jgi:triphosphoribosyl-dephospho-CoA synthase
LRLKTAVKSRQIVREAGTNMKKRIAQLAQMACVWEACAPKPGNVNRSHDFDDTSLEDFLLSAIAIGPALENADQKGVGRIVLDAAHSTLMLVKSNTNLGIVLLIAPLAKAWMSSSGGENIRQSLSAVLNALTVEDARLAYEAIRLMQPGGLGQVSRADVRDDPSVTLLQAMALAKDRDSIAREYATGYEITFETGLPALKEAQSRNADFPDAIVQAFLTILSRVPDTLIARKKGTGTARQVSQMAADVLAKGGMLEPEGRTALAEMDTALRDPNHTMNPGTTADLTAAAVFLDLCHKAIY